MTDLDILTTLSAKLDSRAPTHRKYELAYNGAKQLSNLGVSLPPEMTQLAVVMNWPRMVADSLEERIDLEGFRLGNTEYGDERLWRWWQDNNLDEDAGPLNTEAFVQGSGYITVGYDEDNPDTPIFTVESSGTMVVDVDERTRKVKAAVRVYDRDQGGSPKAATLYLPGKNVYYVRGANGWNVDDEFETEIDVVPVVPLVNRGRISDRDGKSELDDVIDLTDACCRALTGLQGAQELLAVPSRYIFGVTEADMVKADGTRVSKWEAYTGRYNTLEDTNARVEQLAAADLRNFTEAVNLYSKLIGVLTGLPPHYVGMSTDNPASAEAIRSSESRLIKRAERKMKMIGGAWEEAMRIGMLIVDGTISDDAKRMEAIFADAATPTYASKVDAAVKLYASGQGILPLEAVWEELGYSQQKIQRLREMAADDPTSKLLASVGLTSGTGTLDTDVQSALRTPVANAADTVASARTDVA